MEWDRTAKGRAVYAMRDDDTDEVLSEVHLEAETYNYMGQPDVLTVTIEPGDLLNKERR